MSLWLKFVVKKQHSRIKKMCALLVAGIQIYFWHRERRCTSCYLIGSHCYYNVVGGPFGLAAFGPSKSCMVFGWWDAWKVAAQAEKCERTRFWILGHARASLAASKRIGRSDRVRRPLGHSCYFSYKMHKYRAWAACQMHTGYNYTVINLARRRCRGGKNAAARAAHSKCISDPKSEPAGVNLNGVFNALTMALT